MIRAFTRTIFAGFAALGTLLVGAWMGGAVQPAKAAAGRPPRATDPLSYGRGQQSGEIPVGDALEVNGQAMQLSLFYTPDPPSKVADFYAREFRSRGVMPIVAAEHDITHVSGFDPVDGLQRFVNALAQPDGHTLVMVGVANPRRPPRLTMSAGEGSLPVPVEHRGYLGYRSDDDGRHAQVGQYVSPLSGSDLLAFYRRELPARGFTEREQDGSPGFVVFAKGGSVLSVAVQALDEKRGSAVFVQETSSEPQ
jgi:hypothetical protein